MVIPTLNDEAVLARVLNPLVPAAVTGLVREVIVADGGSGDLTLEIADDAGCVILNLEGEGRGRQAAAQAVSVWVMILQPTVQLLPGWETAVREHVEMGRDQGAYLPLLDPGAGVMAKLAGLFPAKGPQPAVIFRRERYAASGAGGSLRRLTGGALSLKRTES